MISLVSPISMISDAETKSLFPQFWKHLQAIMYPKVKVREQNEEVDQYNYERSSLQSLKANEWLSLDHYSASDAPLLCCVDERRQSAVRVPSSYFPNSPMPGCRASKEESKTQRAVLCENRKKVRAASAPRPRPRAVLSSPDNDGIFWSKTQTRRELLSALKSHNLCQNRHTKCKIFPVSPQGA